MARQIVKVPEFARLAAVSPWSIYRGVERGEIPVIRIGGSLRIDVDEALAALRVPAHAGER